MDAVDFPLERAPKRLIVFNESIAYTDAVGCFLFLGLCHVVQQTFFGSPTASTLML